MMAKYLRLLLILLLGAVTSCKTTQQKPQQPTGKEAKREFRGAWIQTAFQGEYKDMTPVQMRKDFIRKLDYLQKCGFLSNRLVMGIDLDKFLNTAELVSKAEYNADIAALVYLDMVY